MRVEVEEDSLWLTSTDMLTMNKNYFISALPLPAPVSRPTKGNPSPTSFLSLVLSFPFVQTLTKLFPISFVTAP